MKKPSLSEIEQSLIEQLEQMGASVDFYKSLVSDYLFYEKQERKMQADIRKRGLTYMAVSAVGKEYEKDNPSVKQAYMYNKQKLQILKDLGLSTDKSEIGKDYTLAHIEKTQKKLKYNSISRNYGNTLKPKNGGLHL